MKFVSVALVASVVCGTFAVTTSATRAGQVPFRAGVETVVVDVAVRQDGVPVRGLTAADFKVMDNGVAQTVTNISHDMLPIDVTLIADISRMREGPLLDAFRRAMDRVLEQRRPDDRARLVLFDPRIREVELLESHRLSIEADTGISPDTATSLLDALAVSLIRPPDPGRRRMAILFSSGRDGGSFLAEEEVVEVATRSGVTVFAVALTDGTTRTPQPPPRPGLMQSLTATTGGVLTVLQRDEDLTQPFVNALDDFRLSYVLQYTPTGVPRTGWHTLEVDVLRPGRYDVRARKGYFGAGTPASAEIR